MFVLKILARSFKLTKKWANISYKYINIKVAKLTKNEM